MTNSAHKIKAPAAAILDEKVLKSLYALDGSGQFFCELAETFIYQTRRQLVDMKKLTETHVIDRLKKEAHSLKSAAANMGAHDLSHFCKDLESVTASESTASLLERWSEIEAEFQKVVIALDSEMAKTKV